MKVKIFSSILLFVFAGSVLAQDSNTSELIKKAMRDEIERNMKELSLPEHDNPFFIAFAIGDIETMNIASVLGFNVSSNINKTRTNTSRVMVGNYQVNDENYTFSNYNGSNDISYLGLPIDNDYYGIRRAIWISVNNVYKSAAQKYKSKIKELERNKLHIDSLELKDFSEEKVQVLDVADVEFDFDKEKYEKFADEISVLFRNQPEISNSSVSIYFYKSRVYFVNSEGTNVSFPMTLASINIDAATLCADGTSAADNFSYIAATPDGLPNKETVSADLEKFVSNLLATKNAVLYEDSYEGPVLFTGNHTSEIFTAALFKGTDNLIASREPLSLDNNSYYRKAITKSRIGKKFAHKDISVQVLPKLKSFQGKKLIGHMEVDGEGVIPPDTIELLKAGKIVGLLNNRTPTREENKSNGHFRPNVSMSYLSRSVTPSIVKVESANPLSIDTLKAKLIAKAKKEDLEYAIIFRSIPIKGSIAPVNAYKVDLETGKEQLIRGISFSKYNGYDLKDIIGVSDKKIAVNSTIGGYGTSGSPYSIICPDAILFEEMELEGSRAPFVPELPIMPSPLEEANEK